ncbi:MAG: Biotin--protein ligase [Ignavibacteriae bacterium]|nr:MAG: Biotin--protein ligase [Ignavibacteriota bacterium]
MNIDKIKNLLKTKYIGKAILFLEQIDSTNNYLKNLEVAENSDGLVVIAENQTKGRGRYDRKWYSQPGKNLTFSVLMTPTKTNLETKILPIITASAICKAVENYTGIHIHTKWPNDLILNGKKLGGILIETTFETHLKKIIIGIGLNVNQSSFDNEVKLIATSLYLNNGREYDREVLLSHILNSLDEMYHKLILNDYLDYIEDWKMRCNHFKKTIIFEYNGESYKGIARELTKDGCLIVNSDGKDIKIFSGEIFINKEG